MQGQGRLSGGRELAYINCKDSYLGSLFQRIIDSVNNLGQGIGVTPFGKIPPPPKIDSLQVKGTAQPDGSIKCNGEILHWSLTHNQAVNKGVQYLTEVDTDPSFPNPHVYDHGCSRSGFMSIPSQDDNGNPVKYYMRSYAQYHGSNPQKPTVLGGLASPTPIIMGGSTKGSLLTSTGSGTAAPNGQQGGKGLGTLIQRPAPGPKRSTA